MRRNALTKIFFLVLIISLLCSCATTAKPSGGASETTGTGLPDPDSGVADVGETTTYRIKIPNLLDDSALPEGDGGTRPGQTPTNAEIPITGSKAASEYHNSHKVLRIQESSITAYNFTEWHDQRTVLSLIDGNDNYFNTEGGGNKMGGSVNGELIIEFRLTRASKVVGYAFVTGNDSGSYADRTPGSWTLSGSNDGKTWTVLDAVEDGGMQAADHEYFGYEVDPDKQGNYLYYRLLIDSNLMGFPLTSFQLNALYIYSD